jgi:hypothetical protein
MSFRKYGGIKKSNYSNIDSLNVNSINANDTVTCKNINSDTINSVKLTSERANIEHLSSVVGKFNSIDSFLADNTISFNRNRLSHVAEPKESSDVVTKSYVDKATLNVPFCTEQVKRISKVLGSSSFRELSNELQGVRTEISSKYEQLLNKIHETKVNSTLQNDSSREMMKNMEIINQKISDLQENELKLRNSLDEQKLLSDLSSNFTEETKELQASLENLKKEISTKVHKSSVDSLIKLTLSQNSELNNKINELVKKQNSTSRIQQSNYGEHIDLKSDVDTLKYEMNELSNYAFLDIPCKSMDLMRGLVLYNKGSTFWNVHTHKTTYDTLMYATIEPNNVYMGIVGEINDKDSTIYQLQDGIIKQVWLEVANEDISMVFEIGTFIGPSDIPGFASIQSQDERFEDSFGQLIKPFSITQATEYETIEQACIEEGNKYTKSEFARVVPFEKFRPTTMKVIKHFESSNDRVVKYAEMVSGTVTIWDDMEKTTLYNSFDCNNTDNYELRPVILTDIKVL